MSEMKLTLIVSVVYFLSFYQYLKKNRYKPNPYCLILGNINWPRTAGNKA